jgi:hypothetical protein
VQSVDASGAIKRQKGDLIARIDGMKISIEVTLCFSKILSLNC